jgi:transposase InsO family protein
MSRTATPTDNPVIESLNGWDKAELKHNLKTHDFTDIKTAIELYINNRGACKLDYLTPVEFRTINGFT